MGAPQGHHEADRRPGPRGRTGFAACLAWELAHNRRVDHHVALELLACGYPPELAVGIAVAPEHGRAAA